MNTNLRNEMPEFLNYREAENNAELVQERIWVLWMNLETYQKEIDNNTTKIREFVKLGARPAAIRLSKENRNLESKIARDEAELTRLVSFSK